MIKGVSPITESRQLMLQCSKTKAGKALLDYIESECCQRMRGSTEEIQLQAGKFNLWLDIQSEIIAGKSD
jgi:hypothetical protein